MTDKKVAGVSPTKSRTTRSARSPESNKSNPSDHDQRAKQDEVLHPRKTRKEPTTSPSMADRLIKLLQGAKGVTMAQMTKATGWQSHSVRGILSRALRKDRGLTVVCEVSATGERRYRIVGQ